MSLLTALLALAPSGLLARREREPEADSPGVKMLAEMRATMDERFTALHRQIDDLTAENARLRGARDAALHHVLEENARLRRENHMLNVMLRRDAQQPPVQGPILGAPYQQNQGLAAQARMLNAQAGLAQAQMNAQQWRPCTCVPGRYDALRQINALVEINSQAESALALAAHRLAIVPESPGAA
jgi:hypothetical protein